jgi:hypothetical protein
MGEQERATTKPRVPKVLGAIALLSAAISAVGFAVVSPPAQSTPEYQSQFNAKYDMRGSKLDSCLTCHTTQAGGKEAMNPYGTDFGAANHDFGAIEGKDSDGDGVTNIDEIKAESFPGDPNDKPKPK